MISLSLNFWMLKNLNSHGLCNVPFNQATDIKSKQKLVIAATLG